MAETSPVMAECCTPTFPPVTAAATQQVRCDHVVTRQRQILSHWCLEPRGSSTQRWDNLRIWDRFNGFGSHSCGTSSACLRGLHAATSLSLAGSHWCEGHLRSLPGRERKVAWLLPLLLHNSALHFYLTFISMATILHMMTAGNT